MSLVLPRMSFSLEAGEGLPAQGSFSEPAASFLEHEDFRPSFSEPALSVAVPAPSGPSLLQRRLNRGLKVPSLNCGLIAAEASPRRLDLPSLGDRYELKGALGQGSAAVVYAARRREDGQQVALKVVRTDDEEHIATCEKEFSMLRSLEHPNIIRALDFFTSSSGAVLVLEQFSGSNLEVAVQRQPSGYLEELAAQRIFAALTEAVAYLHDKQVMHRDVKPENVLVSHDLLDARLTDFNVACTCLDGDSLTLTGTIDFLPPEVLIGDSLTQASDVWALGLCLHFMLLGALPLRRNMFSSHVEYGEATVLSFQAPGMAEALRRRGLSEACRAVLLRCLEVRACERPSAQEICSDDWLAPAAPLE